MLSVKERKRIERKKYMLIAFGVLWAGSLIFLLVHTEFKDRFYWGYNEDEITIGPKYEEPITEKKELLQMLENNDNRFLGGEDLDPVIDDEPAFNNGVSLEDPRTD